MCALDLRKMSGEVMGNEVEDIDDSLNPDWSVSCISTASGFDPDQFTRENNVYSPEDASNVIGRDEIDQLINNVNDLRGSLATISEKSITPTNSPRTSETNATVIEKNGPATGNTPPVKDVGRDSSVGKLEHMRRMLRDLENGR